MGCSHHTATLRWCGESRRKSALTAVSIDNLIARHLMLDFASSKRRLSTAVHYAKQRHRSPVRANIPINEGYYIDCSTQWASRRLPCILGNGVPAQMLLVRGCPCCCAFLRTLGLPFASFWGEASRSFLYLPCHSTPLLGLSCTHGLQWHTRR
jgi:hypothetical protein